MRPTLSKLSTTFLCLGILVVSLFFCSYKNKTIASFTTTTILPENFGKTHFISGFDHSQQVKRTRNSAHKKRVSKANNDPTEPTVLFAPHQDVCTALCQLIDNEQVAIHIAIYTLTDKKITDHLKKALLRGVTVEIITEQTTILDKYSRMNELAKSGAHVMIHNKTTNKHKGLMHNKFAIFHSNKENRPVLWHGSFNFTRSGYSCNCESVIVLREESIVNSFKQEFQHIKKGSLTYLSPTHVYT